jgi:AcrR family transcriptional regulator
MDGKLKEIIDTCETLFTRRGIKSVSMDDIAEALGVSKKTVYKYVRDKQELVKLSMESLLKKFTTSEHNCPKGLNAIDEYLHVHLKVSEMIKSTNFIMEADLKKYYPRIFTKLNKIQEERMTKSITKNLIRGVEEGLYRPEIDIEMIALVNVHLSLSMRQYDFLTNNRDHMLRIMKSSFDLHLRSIVTAKGLEEYLRLKNSQEYKYLSENA